MAQEILFLRNAATFESYEAAIEGLNGLTHKVGKPVVAVYQDGEEVKMIAAIGKAAGTGAASYEILASVADANALLEAFTNLNNLFKAHVLAVASETALGHIKAGGDIEISEAGVVTVPELADKAPLESPELTGTPLAPTAAKGTNTKQIATTEYVQTEISEKLADLNAAMVYRGTIGTDGTIEALPEDAQVGDTYVGIAGAPAVNGVAVEPGDLVIFLGDSTWTVAQTNIDGAVVGPTSSVDANLAIFDGTTGKVIKDSNVGVADLVLKTRKVEAGEGLSGGGALEGDVTISHAEAPTSGSAAPVAEDSTGAFITGVKVDKFGHIAEVEKGDYTESGKVKVVEADEAGYLGAKFGEASVSGNEVAVEFSTDENNKVVAKVTIDVIDGGTY